jgi:hypothetical protein
MTDLARSDEAPAPVEGPLRRGRRQRAQTYVTVTYRAELALLRLQARSFRKFVPPKLVERIVVIINEVDAAETLDAFRRDILPEYGDLARKVEVVQANELMADRGALRGWRKQQTLKLLYARRTTAAAYIVLDSKNHFIKRVSDTTFVGAEGRARSFRAAQRGSLMPYFVNSLRYFGLDPAEHVDRAMPATTPYVLDSAAVRDLLDDIEDREGVSFEKFFHAPGRDVTEFFLYFAHLLRSNSVETLYRFGPRNAATLFTRWPESEEDIEQVLAKARKPSSVMFGLHKNRVGVLTGAHRKAVTDIWVEAGLFEDEAEAEAWLRALADELELRAAEDAARPVEDLQRFFRRGSRLDEDEASHAPGSTLAYTEKLRAWLPGLVDRLKVRRFLDAACGDFNWMRTVPLDGVHYTGMDIDEDLVAALKARYEGSGRTFLAGDITRDVLPPADIMLCRDCLPHLPYEFGWRVLENFARSGIPHLLVGSHFIRNRDIARPGQWRQLNLQAEPFFLPAPLDQVDDWIAGRPRRIIGLWSAEQIKSALALSGRVQSV